MIFPEKLLGGAKAMAPVKGIKQNVRNKHDKITQQPFSKRGAYPKVLINPFTVPSAYSETMSPLWRKLDL